MFHISFPQIDPQRLAVKLNSAGEKSAKQGHPWIFSESIVKLNKEGNSGDLAIIFDARNNSVIGVGLYDPHSPIRIKMLHNEGPATINRTFFIEKIAHAYALRLDLLQTHTNSYRLLFGENDGFPGCIADVYNDVLVVKLYSEIWFPYLEDIITELINVSQCLCVVLRLSRSLQKRDIHQVHDGQVIYGELTNKVVEFTEHGINFSAHVIKGHKTGYFLDHRHNRKRVGALSMGKTVVDVFSYAGGFSVHALAQGATEVTSIDISAQALGMAVENSRLNEFAGRHVTLAGDAFTIMTSLIKENKQYDVVVIDPPSFAKSKGEIAMAKKKYGQLAMLGVQLTKRGGILMMASCSSRVPASDFFTIISETITKSGRSWQLLEQTAHDVDHPVTFPEGAYLKCGYYQLN